jgi:hypothetical protein
MKTISHTLLLLITIALTVATAILYVYMQYTIQASISHVISGKQTILGEEANISRGQSMVDTYSRTMDDRNKMLNIFLSANKAVSFIDSIEGLGSYTGSDISISSVSSEDSDITASSTFSNIKAHVEVKGSWMAIMRTLRLSETLPYQVLLSNVRLNSSSVSSKSGDKHTWSLLFDVSSNMITMANATSSPK